MKKPKKDLYNLVISDNYEDEIIFKGSKSECNKLKKKLEEWFDMVDRELYVRKQKKEN